MNSNERIRVAYRKLKRLVYYDNTDLKLRLRLAEFECDTTFEEKLRQIEYVITNSDQKNSAKFRNWLKEISFRLVPKSVKKGAPNGIENKREVRFVSNVSSAKIYEIEKVNHFFDGPIELQMIVLLWIMKEGWRLDRQLGSECYGSRLESIVGQDDDKSATLYRKYHEQYSGWRDDGIRKAKHLLTIEKKNVCILGLDLQEYYYRIRVNFDDISRAVQETEFDEEYHDELLLSLSTSKSALLECVHAICQAYWLKIYPLLALTNPQLAKLEGMGLPIGLCASSLIANWYIRDFDKKVKTKIRPAYYGRYVDDMLFVVHTSENPSRDADPVAGFVESVLVKTGLLNSLDKENNR